MPQRVRADVLGDPRAAGDAADDPGDAVPVMPPPVSGGERRGFTSCWQAVSEGSRQPDFFFLESQGCIEVAGWDIGYSGMQGEMTQPAVPCPGFSR